MGMQWVFWPRALTLLTVGYRTILDAKSSVGFRDKDFIQVGRQTLLSSYQANLLVHTHYGFFTHDEVGFGRNSFLCRILRPDVPSNLHSSFDFLTQCFT